MQFSSTFGYAESLLLNKWIVCSQEGLTDTYLQNFGSKMSKSENFWKASS